MTDADTYFTQSIVGAPFSAVLGERASSASLRLMGFERAPETSLAQLRAFCQDELLIGASSLGPFVRRLPSAQRRWLERHALAVAAAGFLALWAAGLTVLWTYLS